MFQYLHFLAAFRVKNHLKNRSSARWEYMPVMNALPSQHTVAQNQLLDLFWKPDRSKMNQFLPVLTNVTYEDLTVTDL
jgi:hypothetical protein